MCKTKEEYKLTSNELQDILDKGYSQLASHNFREVECCGLCKNAYYRHPDIGMATVRQCTYFGSLTGIISGFSVCDLFKRLG